MEIGKIFEFARKLQCHTQDEIAERVNIDRSAIAHFEAGRYPLSASTINSIAEALGFNPGYFEGTSKELFTKRDNIIYLFLTGKNFKADLTEIEKFLNLKSDIVQIVALRLSVADGFIKRKRINAVYAICMRDIQDNIYLFLHRNADYCLGDISRIGEYMHSIGYRFTDDIYVSLDLFGHIKSRTVERDWIDKILRPVRSVERSRVQLMSISDIFDVITKRVEQEQDATAKREIIESIVGLFTLRFVSANEDDYRELLKKAFEKWHVD